MKICMLKHLLVPVSLVNVCFVCLWWFRTLHIRGSNNHVLLDFFLLYSLVAVNVYAFPTFVSFGFFFVLTT